MCHVDDRVVDGRVDTGCLGEARVDDWAVLSVETDLSLNKQTKQAPRCSDWAARFDRTLVPRIKYEHDTYFTEKYNTPTLLVSAHVLTTKKRTSTE